MTAAGSASVSYGHTSQKPGVSANARFSSASWRWHSTLSAGPRSGEIGSPLARRGGGGAPPPGREPPPAGGVGARVGPAAPPAAERTPAPAPPRGPRPQADLS